MRRRLDCVHKAGLKLEYPLLMGALQFITNQSELAVSQIWISFIELICYRYFSITRQH